MRLPVGSDRDAIDDRAQGRHRRELAAVLPARADQRVRRRDGRPRANRRAPDRHAGISPDLGHAHLFVHRGVRRRQSTVERRSRNARGSIHTKSHAGRRLGDWIARAVHARLGPVVELDPGGERPVRGESGVHVVDDHHDEERSREVDPTRARDGIERVRWIWRTRRNRSADRIHRGPGGPSPGAVLSGYCVRGPRTRSVSRRDSRYVAVSPSA